MIDDLTALGPQGFERLCQALATYVLGPGIIVFGDGPDGGREATFAGLRHYPARETPWAGHGVLQAKFKQRLLGTGGDTTWLRKQLKAELAAWADSGSRRVRDGQRPEYLIMATNIPLSAVPHTGGKDRINSLIAEFAPAIGLKDWRIWDAVQIGARFLTRSRMSAGRSLRSSRPVRSWRRCGTSLISRLRSASCLTGRPQ